MWKNGHAHTYLAITHTRGITSRFLIRLDWPTDSIFLHQPHPSINICGRVKLSRHTLAEESLLRPQENVRLIDTVPVELFGGLVVAMPEEDCLELESWGGTPMNLAYKRPEKISQYGLTCWWATKHEPSPESMCALSLRLATLQIVPPCVPFFWMRTLFWPDWDRMVNLTAWSYV